MQNINEYNVYIPILDDDIIVEEVNNAVDEIGTRIGVDGLNPSLTKLFTIKFKLFLVKFLNRIHGHTYPDNWKRRVLVSVTKKGHKRENPKLRGIAISSVIPKIYDVILNNRFKCWYHPKSQQAGFRPKQGCLIQIFAMFLMIELANYKKKSLFVGFMDYEKAFDFTNRADIVNDLMKNGAGAKFINTVANMYDETIYTPKTNNNSYGNNIMTRHGVTQGRKTSPNFFSFNISDMHEAISIPTTFLKDVNLLQLADDTVLLAETSENLTDLFRQVLKYSSKKYMVANILKTCYMHFNTDPNNEPLLISDDITISAAKDGKYLYLGMLFICSNDITEISIANLKHRAFNIKKFYDWIEINENTPIKVKLQVLDMGLKPGGKLTQSQT